MSRAVSSLSLLAAVGSWGAGTAPTRAAGAIRAALAALMNDATGTLQDGLKASAREGTPLSAKFEIQGGRLQLSVYTIKGNDLMEVVVDPKTGVIAKAEKITNAEDLMAAETVVKTNACFRAISIFPELKNGEANAEVTLSAWGLFKKVTQKLDCGHKNAC